MNVYSSVTDKLSESLNIVANEPSLAFFRIQEHVRKCLPQLAETKVHYTCPLFKTIHFMKA